MVVKSVAPVANTITSTTSATQDLEVFKNYPTEKNNKLLKKKYGNKEANFLDYEKNFFQKVAAEGHAEGFKGRELNLPATGMLNEAAMKQFTDPSGLSAYKGTELEKYAGTQDLTRIPPTMQSTFPGGQEIPIGELEKWKTMDKSGITELGQLWNQAGGEFPTPTSYPSMSMEKDRIRQAKEAELYGINAAGISTGAPIYTDDKHVMSQAASDEIMNQGEGKPSIYNKRLNDGIMYSDGEMRKQGFSEDQIRKANQIDYSDGVSQFEEQPDHDKRRKEQSQLYGLDAIGVSTGAPQDKTGIKSIKEVKEKKSDLSFIEALQEDLKNLPENIKKAKEAPPLTIFGEGWEAGKEDFDRHESIKKRAAEVGYDVGWLVNKDEFKEIQKREDIMKKAELLETGDPDAGIKALEKYVSGLKKEDDDKVVTDKEVTKDPDFTKVTEKDGIIQVGELPAEPLKEGERSEVIDQYYIKKRLARKLNQEEQKELETGLEGKGVKTKGLTDNNMLLIAMGLGIMASDKPGLQGLGSGALTGLKTVAPMLTKKASDFQIVEVADKDNPGQTKLVKINKRTNEVTDLGVGGKGQKTETQRKYEWMSTVSGKPVKNLVMRDLALKDKKKTKQERIEAMAKYIWGQDILGGTQADIAGYIKKATEMIEAIDKIPNADLDSILGL